MTTSRRFRVAFLLLVVGALAVTGCNLPFQSPATLTASAKFTDVGDLSNGASVQMASIPVGHVTDISLVGNVAKVTMVINQSADVPKNLSVQLRRTSLLGEQYVDLIPDNTNPGGPMLTGEVIGASSVQPGIAQLLSAGATVIGGINSTQLADLVANSAQGFGGQGANLRSLLDSLSTVIHGYAGRTATITSLITNADQLTATLAPEAAQNAQAISTLSQTTGVLANQSDRLVTLLQSLNDLSVQSSSILSNYTPQIDDQLSGLAATANALQASESDIGNFLDFLPGHNAALQEVTRDNQAQILTDLIICGLPGGGSNSSEPAFTCGSSK
ncbi:MAG TPA: MCE family protein [Acidimicrobiales bacterium]|jgi:phospholipid/cholesterol/gamma-HCH transport system substrate-binding protein|nr:MCE family protein [Acidimicrobiales bacterium]